MEDHTLKKITSCLFFLLLMLILSSCNPSNGNNSSHDNNNPNFKIIKTAYNSLSDSEKKEIKGDWKDSTVDESVVTKQSGLDDLTYDGKEAYVVTFLSKESQVRGNIAVFISKDTHKVIGKGFRD